jgi:transposase-like protein
MVSMFTMKDLDEYVTAPKQLMVYLRNKNLLQPRHFKCSYCSSTKAGSTQIYDASGYIDDGLYRCTKCSASYSLRYQSIFSHTEAPMLLSCRMLVCFDLQITVNQAYQLLSLERDVVSRFYRRIREALLTYNLQHWKKYTSDDIIESDECFLPHLVAVGSDEEDMPACYMDCWYYIT